MTGSDLQRERDVPSCLRRFIDAEYELEGLPARSSISFGLCVPPKHRKDISIVALVTISVDVRRIALHRANAVVIGIRIGEFPVLNLVYRGSTNLCGAL